MQNEFLKISTYFFPQIYPSSNAEITIETKLKVAEKIKEIIENENENDLDLIFKKIDKIVKDNPEIHFGGNYYSVNLNFFIESFFSNRIEKFRYMNEKIIANICSKNIYRKELTFDQMKRFVAGFDFISNSKKENKTNYIFRRYLRARAITKDEAFELSKKINISDGFKFLFEWKSWHQLENKGFSFIK